MNLQDGQRNHMMTKFHNTNLSKKISLCSFLSSSVRHIPHICMSLSAHTHFHKPVLVYRGKNERKCTKSKIMVSLRKRELVKLEIRTCVCCLVCRGKGHAYIVKNTGSQLRKHVSSKGISFLSRKNPFSLTRRIPFVYLR